MFVTYGTTLNIQVSVFVSSDVVVRDIGRSFGASAAWLDPFRRS